MMGDHAKRDPGDPGMRDPQTRDSGMRNPDTTRAETDLARADGITAGRYEGPTVPVARDGQVWDDGTWQDLHDRWREVQLRFVDDPPGSIAQAQSIVDEAVDGYTRALTRRRGELDSWRSAGNADTEVLRTAMRQYRDFLETLH